jgi:hypothetical protein
MGNRRRFKVNEFEFEERFIQDLYSSYFERMSSVEVKNLFGAFLHNPLKIHNTFTLILNYVY